MTVLMTGGAGYIGSHTAVELLKAGYNPVIIDNYYNSKPEALKRVKEITGKVFKVYKADILDVKSLRKVFSQNSIEVVIHFAGLKAVGESVEMPLSYYNNNVAGTVALCQVMQEYGVQRIVFSSSATIYGAPERMPISEDFSLKAVNPYGRTKLMIEEILQDLHASKPQWSVSLLRYYNPVGAHVSGRIGEDPKGVPNNLMPYISQVAVGKQEKLRVFGNDYKTHDGTGVRDYIHVVDLAKGHIKALENMMGRTGVEAYNLGTGRGYSVLDVVKTFEQATGKRIPYEIVNRRPGDIAACYANPHKAYRELGWKAEQTLEDMCRDSWRWQYNNPEGY